MALPCICSSPPPVCPCSLFRVLLFLALLNITQSFSQPLSQDLIQVLFSNDHHWKSSFVTNFLYWRVNWLNTENSLSMPADPAFKLFHTLNHKLLASTPLHLNSNPHQTRHYQHGCGSGSPWIHIRFLSWIRIRKNLRENTEKMLGNC